MTAKNLSPENLDSIDKAMKAKLKEQIIAAKDRLAIADKTLQETLDFLGDNHPNIDWLQAKDIT